MLTLVSPWWLAGLLLLPLMRWLHRGGQHRRALAVSHGGLWRGSAASLAAPGQRQPPDPAWRRRALLMALALLALAQPQWPTQRMRVTLWIDDSPSMLTREAQGTRLSLGLAQARRLLDEQTGAERELRTLRNPWRRVDPPNDVAVAALAASAGATGRAAAAPPPAALLAGDRQHWLISDGTRPGLLSWPGQRQPDRVIQVGGTQRNVGLERLSARRETDGRDHITLLLQVANGGTAAETRTVIFSTEAGEVARSTQALAPGQTVQVAAHVPASAQARAQLQPGDALAEDDTIILDLGPLRSRRVTVDARCPAALIAAVAAHPALSPAPPDAAAADAALECGTTSATHRLPTIRVHADHAPQPGTGALQWAATVADTERPRLDPRKLPLAAKLDGGREDTVLLALGEAPAIVGRAGAPRVLDTALDFEAMAATRGPELPLLVNWLFERLLGQRLLDATALVERGSGSARIVAARPTDTAPAAPTLTPAPAPARAVHDLVPPVLLAVLALLLWEIVALGRQWRHLARPLEAE